MSKLRFKWLWAVVIVEILIIAGLLVWAVALRQSEAPQDGQQTSQQDAQPELNTPKVELERVATGLSQPTAIAALPDANDRRLFVAEQEGTIKVVTADRTVEETPFLDISGKVQGGGERGLLGLAFHPKANENNYFYVNYTDNSGDTVVSRYTISADTGRADPSSEKVLLTQEQPFANHNGGQLAFGPDGYLYIGLGDGGSAGDPGNRAQNKESLLGKILRLDVDGGDPYAVPDSNPLVKEDGKSEVWALGLRNPWRFSFDRQTGDLFIADVGQGDWEEINFQKAASTGGENYGWRCYESTHEFNTEGCQPAENYVKPITEYDHSQDRCSVTGGYVYRGSQFPALSGKYFYGDYCGGQLYYAEQTSEGWQQTLAVSTSYKFSTFGQDGAGEVYATDYASGNIYLLTDTAN